MSKLWTYPLTLWNERRHWVMRFGFFLLGIVLLYAPFALLTRLLLWLTRAPYTADVHRICLRMPIQWLSQPWMYSVYFRQPLYLGAVLVLPAMAMVTGPLFCGWMCPAGGMTEFLSRLVPSRFQIDLAGKVSPAPVRYGFTIGFMIASFVGGNVCCSFCNFTHAQNLVSGVFGEPFGLAHWSSFAVVGFGLWFVLLGLFTRGGRGWCAFLCPAGALMGLSHAIGSGLGISRGMRIDQSKCRRCKVCESVCPTWAIKADDDTGEMHIDRHGCNTCQDCAHLCQHGAVSYGRIRPSLAAGAPAEGQAPFGDGGVA